MAFELPPLPYAEDALEPDYTARTISFHYGKHHKTYVDNLNKMIEGTEFADMPLEEIIRMAEQVGEMILHIATAATQQSSTTEQVSASMEQIVNLVRESAVGAQQSAKACHDLSGLALDLQGLVSRFKASSNGRGGGASLRRNGQGRRTGKTFGSLRERERDLVGVDS